MNDTDHGTGGESSSMNYEVRTSHGTTVVEAGSLPRLRDRIDALAGRHVLYRDDGEHRDFASVHSSLKGALDFADSRSYDMWPLSDWWEVRRGGERVYPEDRSTLQMGLGRAAARGDD